MPNQDLPLRVLRERSIQQAGAETLVYDELRHEAFCLNPTSSEVWRLCDGSRTVLQIAEQVAKERNAPVSEEIVLLAIQELRRHGLVESSTSLVPAALVSRRALIGRLSAGAVLMLPVVAMIVAPEAAHAYNGGFSSGREHLLDEPIADPYSIEPHPAAPAKEE